MTILRRRNVLAAAAIASVVGIAGGGARWRAMAAEPAGQGSVPPELTQAVQMLSSAGDVHAADEAVEKLKSTLVEQTRSVIAAQKLVLQLQDTLAKELTALTGVKDAEGSARVAGLLEFNTAIYTWASNAATLESAQRDAVLDWGLKGDNLPLIAKIYGRDHQSKADAIHELAKEDPSPATDYMLGVLLNDKDREISLLTLDALFDRKPAPSLEDALCDHAYGALLNQNRPNQVQAQQQHIVMVHGQQMVFYDNPNQNNGFNQQDASIYADLLIQYHDPKIGEKFDAALASFANGIQNVNDGRVNQIISSNYGTAPIFAKLIDAYKPKSAVTLCIKVLAAPATNAQDQNFNNNGVMGRYHMSTHVDAMALLANATGQQPADYGISKGVNFNNRWMLQGTAADENDSLKKMHDWLTQHGKDYGVDTVDAFPAAPVPADNPNLGGFGGGRGGFGGRGVVNLPNQPPGAVGLP